MKLGMKKGLAQGNPRSDRSGSAPTFSDWLCCGTNVLKKQGFLWKIKLFSQCRANLVNISECLSVKGHKVYASRTFDALKVNSPWTGGVKDGLRPIQNLGFMDGPQGIMVSPESMCVCAWSSIFFWVESSRDFTRFSKGYMITHPQKVLNKKNPENFKGSKVTDHFRQCAILIITM